MPTVSYGGRQHEVQGAVIAVMFDGFDSSGEGLPAGFENLPQVLTYSSGQLQTAARTNGVNTWTQTYTWTGEDLTGISAWVRS